MKCVSDVASQHMNWTELTYESVDRVIAEGVEVGR